VERLIHKMTSGELKSLLQKLIRYASSYVVCGEELYETSEVLGCLMETAILHKGGFVPQLQTNVPGLVSLFKRLAVTIVEDAWVAGAGGDELGNELHDLLLAACIAQADPSYFPTPYFIKKVFSIAQQALVTSRAVVYHCSEAGDRSISFQRGQSQLERCSGMLDWLRSFPWDLTMLRYVAEHRKNLQFEEENKPKADIMCVERYVDHHTAPHLAYYLPPSALQIAGQNYDASEVFGDMDDKEGRPYAKLFRYLFHTCSGVNMRRKGKAHDEEFCKMVEAAQAKLWMEQYGRELLGIDYNHSVEEKKSTTSVEEHDLYDLEYELNDLTIAAELGHIPVKYGGKAFYAFLTRVDPTVEFGVVRVPTRDQKDTEIDPGERMAVIELAKSLLVRKGIALPDQSLFGPGKRVKIYKDKVYFQKAKDVLEPPCLVLSTRTSIPVEDLSARMGQSSLACLRRLYRLTEGYVRQVELPKITRFGGADDKPVHIIDVEVFGLCQALAPLFVLERERFFRITDNVMWFYARENILEPLVKKNLNGVFDCSRWRFHADRQDRTLTPPQRHALQTLQNRNADANLLVMPTGQGKTLTFMHYVMWLAQVGRLPRKVLFVTPKFAMEGVEREIRCFTQSLEVRSMNKGQKTHEPLANFTITLLEQDHMRKVHEMWSDCMADCLFCLDEFHLCLDQSTQRTKYMQAFASGSAMRIG